MRIKLYSYMYILELCILCTCRYLYQYKNNKVSIKRCAQRPLLTSNTCASPSTTVSPAASIFQSQIQLFPLFVFRLVDTFVTFITFLVKRVLTKIMMRMVPNASYSRPLTTSLPPDICTTPMHFPPPSAFGPPPSILVTAVL